MLERTGPRTFRGTGSNHFAGRRFYVKSVDGITDVAVGSAARDRRGESQKEKQRRANQKHLDLYNADGNRLGWDRLEDQRITKIQRDMTIRGIFTIKADLFRKVSRKIEGPQQNGQVLRVDLSKRRSPHPLRPSD